MTETRYGTGRRKTASARVFLREGTGEMTVNGVGMDDYFGSEVLKMIVRQPLQVVEKEGELDMWATVRGGGSSGQAGAIRHGLSRALVEFEPTFRESLKTAGFMTRDPRRKERKKYGQKGARA
ncbi:MAG: 30S ribosomal protein S9, partial [Holophagales bacterium]|nr:30S ribosomal protein S9 [Holophagales bacterium]